MAVEKTSTSRQIARVEKTNPNQNLIDKFNRYFGTYSFDSRATRYLSAMLRLGNIGNHGATLEFMIEVVNTLDLKPNWASVANEDFKRYYHSRKIEENNFDFIGESKCEKFFYENFIHQILNKVYMNGLPCSRDTFGSDFSGPRLIFDEINFSIKEKIIFFFDAWHVSASQKDNSFAQLKFDANKFLQLYNKFKWFDNKPEALQAAHDYLWKLDANCGYFSDSDELRMYFLKTCQDNKDKVELSIRKIQMLFNNRKSRATKATKQINFSLSEKSIRNIKKLSLNHEENASKTVDAIFKNDGLIRYIDKYLKTNKNMHFSGNETFGN